MKNMIAALLTAALATTALAESPPVPKDKQITVAQATLVGNALRRLTYYSQITRGADGKDQVANIPFSQDHPSPYKFSGDVLFAMSVDLQQSDIVAKSYQEAYSALIKQVYGALDKQPKPEADDPKRGDFNDQAERIFQAPSGALMVKIKRDDLCLDVTSKCTQANPIPVDVLSALLPIIDR